MSGFWRTGESSSEYSGSESAEEVVTSHVA
jgi:hypothetical protein